MHAVRRGDFDMALPDRAQHAAMRSEMHDLREIVSLSLIPQQSATMLVLILHAVEEGAVPWV
jgi:hypothetical protein